MKRFRRSSRLLQLLALAVVILPFQNCGKPFRALESGQLGIASEQGTVPEQMRFEKANAVIQSKCSSCHREGGSASFAPFQFNNEQGFVSANLVFPGDISKSKLVYRLSRYADSSVPNRNMPPGGSLTDSEYNDIVYWVSKMGSGSGPFACDEAQGLSRRIVANDMKRLSKRQYQNTLRDLFARAFPSGASGMVNQALSQVTLPGDDDTSFSRFDGSVISQHMKAYFDVADSLTNTALNSSNATTFVNAYIGLNRGSCTTVNVNALTDACARQFINNFGLRALRRPLSSVTGNDEVTKYFNAYTSAGRNVAGLNASVFQLLMAPAFLYRIENDGTAVAGSLTKLGSYSIASRLSYLFWNSMPDEELLARAADGSLTDDSRFLSVLNTVADKAQSEDAIREFTQEWLKLSHVPQFASNNTSLQALANGMNLDASLRTAMINEVEELSGYVYRNNQSFQDLFSSNVSFARDARLVSIYGLATAAPANVTPANAVRFPATERAGLLTRAALLLGGTELANPIKRGIRVRREILCLPLENPPANLADALVPPPPNPSLSTRERYDMATNRPVCMGCHQHINGLGHALGNFNAFGKFQLREPTFDLNGNLSGQQVAINTSVNLSSSLGSGTSAHDAIDYSSMIANQPSTMKCFSQKALRFAEGRAENEAKEGCRLNSLYGKLQNAQSLKEFLKSMAQDAEFRHRLIVY